MSKILVLMCGLPASGKSTFIGHIEESIYDHNFITEAIGNQEDGMRGIMMIPRGGDYIDAVAISADEFIEDFSVQNKVEYADAWAKWKQVGEEMFWASLKTYVAANTTVILVDRMHLYEESRMRTIEAVNSVPHDGDFKVVVVNFVIGPDALKANAADRLAVTGKMVSWDVVLEMATKYTSPTNDAYIYDDVFHVTCPETFEKAVEDLMDYINTYADKKADLPSIEQDDDV